jgi:rifampicin phosphotransferase
MTLILHLEQIGGEDRARTGGKAFALAAMRGQGLNVPQALCICTEAYQAYVDSTGLRDRIFMEIHRKAFEDMRWEEIWDTALRVRNLFLKTSIPTALRRELAQGVDAAFAENPVSVRSSAPGEDSSKTSFAGLHESYVNVRGTEAVLDRVRQVWASLWSDRALLYRRELGLDVRKSSMAVVVQEMVVGDRSGVVFGRSPVNSAEAVVEAVYGLNQGLVDGTVEPDRWTLNRATGDILSHTPAAREKSLRPDQEGVRLETLAPELQSKPPLERAEVSEVFALALILEELFGSPQDVEWTYQHESLHPLQARPITTVAAQEGDQRPWYLSLHRSLENLKALRRKIESELIPAMVEEADQLERVDLSALSDEGLSSEIEARVERHRKWLGIYREDCIPFAHGIRLFGQVYNDVIKPGDPFEFVNLLSETGMVSVRRNRSLEGLASRIRGDRVLSEALREGKMEDCALDFLEALQQVEREYGDLSWGSSRFAQDRGALIQFLLEMASHPPRRETKGREDRQALEAEFLSRFDASRKTYALELLDIARSSYRLRDDDNLFLGRIEGQLLQAVEEGSRRIRARCSGDIGAMEALQVARSLKSGEDLSASCESPPAETQAEDFVIRARQIVGQPAGPGMGVGKARVVSKTSDLFQFKAGEILVCDAVDPNMTFAVPLAAGIVERRGGMLIHGAIIAREYGIPCVTGVSEAASLIQTGDTVTVDGFLGIVIVGAHEMKHTGP